MARLKQYIVRKYVMALSAGDAIKKERGNKVDDVWLDEEWAKQNPLPNNNVGYGKKE